MLYLTGLAQFIAGGARRVVSHALNSIAVAPQWNYHCGCPQQA